MTKYLVFFLEEPSAREMLKGLLPKLLPNDVIAKFIVFEGKQDLERRLVNRLKYWRMPDSCFIVIRDQDMGDCKKIKKGLLAKCEQAERPNAVVRIACHELESFFLGDLQAVEKGLGLKGLSKQQSKRKYREPDRLSNPSQELKRLTKRKYQKVSGSRAIGRFLDPSNNYSRSFCVLVRSIEETGCV